MSAVLNFLDEYWQKHIVVMEPHPESLQINKEKLLISKVSSTLVEHA